jgi:putative redox protein
MNATVKWVDGMQFVGESGTGHAIVMDADAEYGGNDTGMRPTELLLIGLGGCSGMDIISVLKKKKQNVLNLESKVTGEKSESKPVKFVKFNIEYIVTGTDISEDAVKRAVELSMEKYCSVKLTLEGGAKVTYSYKVVNI